jgi:aminocarboxymuconate-semialdehyde decarboxylase
MRIDVHSHVMPPAYLEALTGSGRYETAQDAEGRLVVTAHGARVLTVAPAMVDVGVRLEELDAAGVDMQLLSLSAPNVYFLEGQAALDLAVSTNDYLADLTREYPNRFRALASIPLTADIDTAMRELERAIDQLGMVGVLVGSNIGGLPLDHPGFDPFYEELNRRSLPMFIHPMLPAQTDMLGQYGLGTLVGFMNDMTLAVSRLLFSNFFGRFLSVSVVAAHLGGALPFLAGRLDAGYAAYPECQGINRSPSEFMEHMYFDTVALHEPAMRCAIDTLGHDRLLFGSDYPDGLGDLKSAIQNVESSVRRGARSAMLGETAGKLLGIKG